MVFSFALGEYSVLQRFVYVVELAAYKFTRNMFPNTVFKKKL